MALFQKQFSHFMFQQLNTKYVNESIHRYETIMAIQFKQIEI